MPATFEYFPFDNQPSFEAQWRDMMQNMRSTGIIVQGASMDTSADDCAVIPGTGLQIKIATGLAWIKGHMFKHTVDYEFMSISSNTSGSTRTDLVTLRADFTNNVISYQILEGTTTPVQNTTIWDLPLATVAVPDSATSILPSNIDDLRVSSNHATFRPVCVLRHSADQSISNLINSTLTWDTEDINPMNMHSTTTNPTRINIVENGIYEVKCNTIWTTPNASTTDNLRTILIHRVTNSGATDEIIASGSSRGSGVTNLNVAVNASRIFDFLVGDYLYVEADNGTSATVAVKSLDKYSPVFSVIKVGEAAGI